MLSNYAHFAGNGPWIYAVVDDPPQLLILTWGKSGSGPMPEMIERFGYAKAQRVGRMALVGGKDRRASARLPPQFREVMVGIARSARNPPTSPGHPSTLTPI